MSIERIRHDQVLHEALSARADPLHLALVLGLSYTSPSRSLAGSLSSRMYSRLRFAMAQRAIESAESRLRSASIIAQSRLGPAMLALVTGVVRTVIRDTLLPCRWSARPRVRQRPAPGILSAAMVELPELDSARIAILGLRHSERSAMLPANPTKVQSYQVLQP